MDTIAPPTMMSTPMTGQPLAGLARHFKKRPFAPPPGLRSGHAMTIAGSLRPRRFSILRQSPERREFTTEPGTRVVAYCHWQPERKNHPTVLVIHGLEGNAEAKYVLGAASKAYAAGFNVLRYNVRNCGDTLHLSPKLYHSGLTVDLHHVTRELIEGDGLPQLFVIGFSMGGNQALKFAGELGAEAPPQLGGIVAISPPIDLAECARAIRRRANWIYEIRFLLSLRKTMRRKEQLFPGTYDLNRFQQAKHLWDWDDVMQPYNGFRDAADYYAQASSLPFIEKIRVPTLIIHAEDDPFIPCSSFNDPRVTGNPAVLLLVTRHGGHVAYCGVNQPDEDRAWAENRAVEFCRLLSNITTPLPDERGIV
jgi:uncharacterized protein